MLPLTFKPLSLKTWNDFTALFGERGACGGCWCMLWRLTRKEFEAQKGEGNKKAMQAIVASGETPGILAYHRLQPVGWCAIAPRTAYSALTRSRILKPVDDNPVWSIVCLFLAKPFRHQGIATGLIQAARNYAREQGAEIVEAYAVDPSKEKIPDTFAYHGLASSYARCGFREVARRSATRPIMRYYL